MQIGNMLHRPLPPQALPPEGRKHPSNAGSRQAPGSNDPVDVVTMSGTTQPGQARGNSAYAPAHLARQIMAARLAEGAVPESLRFGDVVSRIARGEPTEGLFTAPQTPETDPDPSAAAGATDDPAGGGESQVAAAPVDDGTGAAVTTAVEADETADGGEALPLIRAEIDTDASLIDALIEATADEA